MGERLRGEVLHVVAPTELDDYDLDDDVRNIAESRYLLVCWKGGSPSIFQRLKLILARSTLEPVTLVTDDAVEEGQIITATVEETDTAGVYDVIEVEDD
ncbi:DUF7526 family protein [Halorientalis pallida]|uniref:Uncharacterized protein n=1 Tax=Halorientalis pallida TaxID=2479928 RepID=A0A498KXQ2_9EURY|nr:hypothetical protein [Halorientalis pallida]RXK50390.1 hypothetical protein EAF64_07505 [Halorientalis pallida]